MTYQELQASLDVLGLSDRVSMKQVKSRYRDLVKRHHPDKAENAECEDIRRINAAYSVLKMYLESYVYSFSEEEFYLQNPEEHLRRQFMDVPLWGASNGRKK